MRRGAATIRGRRDESASPSFVLVLKPSTCVVSLHSIVLAFSSASLSVLERIRLVTLSEIQKRGKPTESCTFFNHSQTSRRLGRDTCQLPKSKSKSKKRIQRREEMRVRTRYTHAENLRTVRIDRPTLDLRLMQASYTGEGLVASLPNSVLGGSAHEAFLGRRLTMIEA
ncbi:uncharacterized protein B0J16DRAFT_36603 [Fusarium flagelliforme]|uniref:uncharacterized protein n=1 Tax=Fusarium flagelliforme TaxID=2675880 RepID=UPI001E8DB642|nr:uncharacterized protein B0J16DRAFT_36603 [Fusarium flagelliforme]KAH7198232.1 hypothetical protein B0J16DRAFT_36603 [Fusarium flagelliforme]